MTIRRYHSAMLFHIAVICAASQVAAAEPPIFADYLDERIQTASNEERIQVWAEPEELGQGVASASTLASGEQETEPVVPSCFACEIACGCDGPCSCSEEVTCGCEGTCDCEFEVSCGCEGLCECETSCGCDSICGLMGGPSSNGCCNSPWFQAELLLWWTSGMPTPTLLAQAPEANIRAGTPIVGGAAGDLLEGMRPGLRIRAGTWLDPCKRLGIEFEYLFLKTAGDFFQYGADGSVGSTVYTRPFFNAFTNQVDAQLISFPGIIRGNGSVEALGDFHSAGVRLVWNQCSQCCDECGPCGMIANRSRFDVIGGYRFASLDESLAIREQLTSLEPLSAGSTFDLTDSFVTSNRFHGFELGMRWQERYRHFTLEFLGKLGFGWNRQQVRIGGQTTTSILGVQETLPGGLLTQSTNIENYTRNRFALIPEIGATLGYHITNNWRFSLGYSLIYWDRVVRPGDQIDTFVNQNLLPPATNGPNEALRPTFNFRENGFVAQGISFGLTYQW